MKITVLGCGSSGGVPLIGNVWGACDPQNPRNRRTRASILVEDQETTLLVDTSPDMRQQLLDCDLQKLDAVLFTHAHADHTHGIDDLRSVNWLTQNPIDVYADRTTLADLKNRFSYIFDERAGRGSFHRPSVVPHEISGPFGVRAIKVFPFPQNHGNSQSLGFRFGEFAYSTDVDDFAPEAIAALRGIKTWIVDCVRLRPHPTHFNLEKTLEWLKKIKPEQAFLTHLNHDMDYETLAKSLPPNVFPAYDGLTITA